MLIGTRMMMASGIHGEVCDRGNLATAAPLIKADLHLSNLQIGLLTAAFFASYVPAQIGAGWAVDRLGGFLALGLGFALWSLATAAARAGLRSMRGTADSFLTRGPRR